MGLVRLRTNKNYEGSSLHHEIVATEIKAASRRENGLNRALRRVAEELWRSKTPWFGVYIDQRVALWDDVRVSPLAEFLLGEWVDEVIA